MRSSPNLQWTVIIVTLFCASFTRAVQPISQNSPIKTPQSQHPDRPKSDSSRPAPSYSCGPITPYTSALPNTLDPVRFKKGERHNAVASTALNEDSEPILIKFPKTHGNREAIPVDSSDAIVTGSILSGQSFLSSDQANIYSEFKVTLQEVLKASGQLSLLAGDNIEIQRSGGSVRLRSGKILARCSAAQSMPIVGRRYLLFLKYNQDTQDFIVNTGYDLDGSHVYRLDDYNPQDDKHGVDHSLDQMDSNEALLLERVKTAIVSERPKGRQ